MRHSPSAVMRRDGRPRWHQRVVTAWVLVAAASPIAAQGPIVHPLMGIAPRSDGFYGTSSAVWSWSPSGSSIGFGGCVEIAQQTSSPPDQETESRLAWADVLRQEADPAIIEDEDLLERFEESGLPWHVRDRTSGIELLLVLPGTYLRGAADDDPYDRQNERPQHEVEISRPFYLGRFEVSNAELRRQRPSHNSGAFERLPRISLDDDNQPAVNVSWIEARDFARHFKLRLPTEAEWEFAARAGITSRYPWGNDITEGSGTGNVFNEKVKRMIPAMNWKAFAWDDGWIGTSPVGSFPPNPWGFHDLFGNAWEYVADSFDDELYSTLGTSVRDPLHDVGGARTLRGGGFGNAPRGSGIPYRYGMPPDSRHFGNGFRVARWP